MKTSPTTTSLRVTVSPRRPTLLIATAAVTLALVLCAPAAHAYVGPGAGLGVIGTLFGIVAAIVLAMFGLLWYPLKRAFGKKTAADGASADDVSARMSSDDTAGSGQPGDVESGRRDLPNGGNDDAR